LYFFFFQKVGLWQIVLGLRLGTGGSYAQHSSTAKGRSVQKDCPCRQWGETVCGGEKRAATATIRFLLRSAANQWGHLSTMMRVINLASGRSCGKTRTRPRPLLTRARPKSCRGRKTPRDLETVSVCLSVLRIRADRMQKSTGFGLLLT
jgi:hypothetical protein